MSYPRGKYNILRLNTVNLIENGALSIERAGQNSLGIGAKQIYWGVTTGHNVFGVGPVESLLELKLVKTNWGLGPVQNAKRHTINHLTFITDDSMKKY